MKTFNFAYINEIFIIITKIIYVDMKKKQYFKTILQNCQLMLINFAKCSSYWQKKMTAVKIEGRVHKFSIFTDLTFALILM